MGCRWIAQGSFRSMWMWIFSYFLNICLRPLFSFRSWLRNRPLRIFASIVVYGIFAMFLVDFQNNEFYIEYLWPFILVLILVAFPFLYEAILEARRSLQEFEDERVRLKKLGRK